MNFKENWNIPTDELSKRRKKKSSYNIILINLVVIFR